MDIETLQIMLTKIAVLSPILIGLVQAVKVSQVIPERFMSFVSVGIGLVFGLLFVSTSTLGALAGIALGLSAIGLYEVGKTGIAGK